jgi:hypothetical protein
MTVGLVSKDTSFSYNGVSLDTLKSSVRARPIKNRARTMVSYVEYNISVLGYIGGTASTTTDATLEDIRAKLSEPGKQLVFQDKGLGTNLTVGGKAAIKDVRYGPSVEEWHWEPIGNTRACKVGLTVTVCIPDCSRATYERALMSGCYEVNYDLDQHGLTTVSITGSIEIPVQHRGRQPSDVADSYRHLVKPPIPLGFQRHQQTYKLSDDRTRLEFTIRDTELSQPLPNGITACDVTEDVESEPGSHFFRWLITFNGQLTVAQGLPRGIALDRFLLIVASRMEKLKANGYFLSLAGQPFPANQDRLAIWDRLRISEMILSNTSRLSVSCHLTGVPLHEILAYSGLWKPIKGTSFAAWTKSLADTALHERGFAKLQYRPGDDTLIDLCEPKAKNPNAGARTAVGIPTIVHPRQPVRFPLPNPDHTWISYFPDLVLEEDPGTIVHVPLVDESSEKDLKVQQIHRPIYRVILRGTAARVAYDIPPPWLKSFGGRKVVRMGKARFSQRTVDSFGGLAINQAAWEIPYLVTRAPAWGPLDRMTSPALTRPNQNPLLGPPFIGGGNPNQFPGFGPPFVQRP